MQRRTLLRYVGAGALSIGVADGVTGTALAGGFDVSFDVEDREAGADDSESVTVDCGMPTTVHGRVVGDESCLTAELVDYSREDGELQFSVGTAETDGDCTDHHVIIEYTIRATELDHRPAGVSVFHDGDRVSRVDCTDDSTDDAADTGDHTDGDDDSPVFEFDADDGPEFHFEDEDPPEFDFGDDADDGPGFDFGDDADGGPEFDFSDAADEGPEFSFPE